MLVAKKRLANRTTGVSASATWSDELTITAIAKSGRLRKASWTPTTFSTALPAIATTTNPANVSLMCSDAVAGCKAETNQSLTKTAPVAVAASTTIVAQSGHRGGSSSTPAPPRKIPSVEKKTTSKTPPQIRLNVCSCAAAGECNVCAKVGTERIAAASSVSVAIVLARG